jgi:hypothetical protein
MPATNEWWWRQLTEAMMEASRLLASFKQATHPNIDVLDNALVIYEDYCQIYNLRGVTFEDFIEHGLSLRTRQAHINNSRGI